MTVRPLAPRLSVRIIGSGLPGLPPGGSAGQVLTKVSGGDYAAAWTLPPDGGGGQQVFVQPAQPAAAGPYLWVQTGLAPNGSGFTFWFEDGLS